MGRAVSRDKDKQGKVEGNPELMTLLKMKYDTHVATACHCILGNDYVFMLQCMPYYFTNSKAVSA